MSKNIEGTSERAAEAATDGQPGSGSGGGPPIQPEEEPGAISAIIEQVVTLAVAVAIAVETGRPQPLSSPIQKAPCVAASDCDGFGITIDDSKSFIAYSCVNLQHQGDC